MLTSLRKKWWIYFRGGWNRLTRRSTVRNKRFLVIQLSSLGDAGTLIPVCLAVHDAGYRLDFLCRADLAPLWQVFFPASHIYTIDRDSWEPASLAAVRKQLKGAEYEAVFATSVSPLAAYLASEMRAGKRYGIVEEGRFYKGARWLLDRVYRTKKGEHVVNRFRNLFGLHAPELRQATWQPNGKFTPDSREIVLIHPGGKWLPRRWPPERYLKVGEALAARGIPVRFLIHQSETDLYAFFADKIGGGKLALEITRDVKDLLRAVQNTRLFIGNDSGPMHLANLFGVPTIILWGPGDYQRIRPLGANNTILIKEVDCRPCRQYIYPDRCERGDNICLKKIAVDEVLQIAEQKLNGEK